MKGQISSIIVFISLVLIGMTASAGKSISGGAYESNIIGTWNCSTSQDQNGMSLKIDVETNYVQNKSSLSFGTMFLKIPEQGIDIEYWIAASGTWSIEDGKLFETVNDMKLKNLTDPAFDEVFNLQDMIPTNVTQSSEILALTKQNLLLASDFDGSELSCSKAF